ncbi:MAG: fasciclin domain-containing protein [Chloroflexota bacterium]
MKRLFTLLLLVLLATAAPGANAQDEFTLIDALERDPDQRFTALLTALETAGLTALLESGEFTLLAPTNGTFRTLAVELDMTEDELLADAELLSAVLPYHVLSGRVSFADFEEIASQRNDGQATVRALSGDRIRLEVDANADSAIINFGEASFIELDLQSDNGIIHVINNVLIPGDIEVLSSGEVVLESSSDEPEIAGTEEALFTEDILEGTIGEILAENDELSLMQAALAEDAFFADLLNDPEREWTLFVPTDEAFGKAAVSAGLTREDLIDSPLLDEILLYHLFSDVRTVEDLAEVSGDFVATQLEGGAVLFVVIGEDDDASVTLNGVVEVIQADIIADNGVIHVIDNVLLPIEALEAFGLQ